MSKVVRSVKNVTKGYSSTQVKVREATSNDAWGPTGTQMSEIAQMTFTSTDFYDIMDMLDKRLNDKGKNWRHVLKALKVLDYCLHEGSEMVVTWAKQSIYIIKTLREFQYIDDDGRDVGQNVRFAAKELTALMDEERLRAERSDRRSWKSRVTGLEEYAPQLAEPSQPRRNRERRPGHDEEDAEYRLAIEASKHQEEEDRKKENRQLDDDDLVKAIKLSKDEEESRRRQLDESNAASPFDENPVQPAQTQHTGFNQGYTQGNPVDFFANPIDQYQMQAQPTGYMNNAYTGFQQNQHTGMQPQASYNPAFGMQSGFGFDPHASQQPPMPAFGPQLTGYNPYVQQPQQQPQQQQLQAPQPQYQPTPPSEPAIQSGSNNPWATNKAQQPQSLVPTPTGSNNPFAQFNCSQSAQPTTSRLSPLPEQKPMTSFNAQTPQANVAQPSFGTPQKSMNEYESKLNALLSTGDGLDTFGNTGDLRIPAQHTAPGTFVNSAGSGAQRLNRDATGNNPFMREQFTGMPSISYGSQTTSAIRPTNVNGQGLNSAFGASRPQHQSQNQDLIQF